MNRLLKNIQKLITTLLLILLGGFGGYYFGVKGYEVNLKKNLVPVEIMNKTPKQPENADFSRFWVVWDDLNANHILRPFDPNKLIDGAIDGMVNAIDDPYTSYFNVPNNQEIKNSLNGKYEGIGAQLGFDEGENLIVVAPLDGSPAQLAGVKAADRILAIEGVATSGLSILEAVDKIRGAAGTRVVLTLARNGVEKPFDTSIMRDTIKLDSVKWEDKGDGIAYIRLSRFGETTNQEWTKAVTEIHDQMPNLKGVILDMRNNPGGFLDSAVFIASEFTDGGVIVREDFVNGVDNPFKDDHVGVFEDKKLKIVVMVDGGSASASEIVSGALKERINATIVGARSFGKGTVQRAQDYADGSSLHVTVAKWLTPNGNWIDKHNGKLKDSIYNTKDENGKEIVGGIAPDIEVKVTDEDIANENDVQLNKAIIYVR